MSGYDEALGRRAVACKAWKFMPGMLFSNGGRALRPHPGHENRPSVMIWTTEALAVCWGMSSAPLPDFTDAATRGCLLDLVRKAWADPSGYVRMSSGGGWVFCSRLVPGGPTRTPSGEHPREATEAEALVAALEAAP